MTLEMALKSIFDVFTKCMNLQIPFFEYNITFWQIFIFVMVIGSVMRLINKPLEREDD